MVFEVRTDVIASGFLKFRSIFSGKILFDAEGGSEIGSANGSWK